MTQACQKAQTKASNYKSLIFFYVSHSSFPFPQQFGGAVVYINSYCFHTHTLHVPIDEYTTCTRHSLNKLVVRYLHGFTMHINVCAFPCCCWGSLCKKFNADDRHFWVVNNYRLILNSESHLCMHFICGRTNMW